MPVAGGGATAAGAVGSNGISSPAGGGAGGAGANNRVLTCLSTSLLEVAVVEVEVLHSSCRCKVEEQVVEVRVENIQVLQATSRRTVNTGGGGGGGSGANHWSSAMMVANGGSGIVIIRYKFQ